ncbi:LEA type 2 family protein [Natronomonas halophila]|uniref:LEA type 2 family protein n=1 Tax=Natronomonas halophila TaxID=2747817 RepID=UPI0015B659D1|nr:LEA type 2 family protein [Natronomonas halophila]QLD85230.1 LEA type 2 family protein [Natronomonas halophila]
MTWDRGLLGLAKLKVAAAVLGVLTVSLVGAAAFGVIGAPSVEAVDNEFGEVTNETTVIHTDLVVNNPNPIGVQLGDTRINYTVRMNEVPMATGGGEGLNIKTGNSTEEFTTEMDNGQIPPWWRSHIENGEVTQVSINATVHTSVLGQRKFDITQERQIETDLIGQFNSDETRPINADDPPPTTSNPILYVNRTGAQWGSVTEQETPINMRFDVYNPQLEPYVVTELGYEITMNGLLVGEGATEDAYVIEGGSTETLNTRAAIQNQQLDEWWVSHLQRGQVTDLRIEFYARVELPTGNTIRVPLDELTYEETIETDIFGNKNSGGSNETATTPNGETTPTPTPTPTPTSTPDDGGLLDETDTATDTETPTDDGIV